MPTSPSPSPTPFARRAAVYAASALAADPELAATARGNAASASAYLRSHLDVGAQLDVARVLRGAEVRP